MPVSNFPWGAMAAVGLNHLVEWADKGIVPPRAAPLEFDNDTANDGSRLALDENGNVKGGVRNAYVDVPVARYGVPNAPGNVLVCAIAGTQFDFDEESLSSHYRNKGSYVSEVNLRLMELTREGCMLPHYAHHVRGDRLRVPTTPP